MISDLTNIERYEMKYRLMPSQVDAVRAFVRPYCTLDPASKDGAYTISSLYFDSPDMRLYRETRDRTPRRFKLRVRRYEYGPYFLEVKRRLMDVVRKTRCPIPSSAWPEIIHDPTLWTTLNLDVDRQTSYDHFVNSVLRIMATPKTVVRYEREAWVSTSDDYGRVTFDYNIVGADARGWDIPIGDDQCWYRQDTATQFGLQQSGVVLELKCTTTVPWWMTDLVNRFGLRRTGFSKYANAVEVTAPESSESSRLRWADMVGGV
jgi:SPX domain protein involved in polyphosphate accumulation